jgi:hypothetical protein
MRRSMFIVVGISLDMDTEIVLTAINVLKSQLDFWNESSISLF